MIYVRDFNVYRHVLVVDPDSGRLEEITEDHYRELPPGVTVSGWFVTLVDGFAGVWRGQDGGGFFYNEKRFALGDLGRWRTEVEPRPKARGKERRRFTFYWDGELAIEVEYDRPPSLGILYATEDDEVDFFVWLQRLDRAWFRSSPTGRDE